MTILVAVVSYNSARLLPDLIAGLRTGLDGMKWHLTVADNASRDDSVAVLRELAPEATVVEMGRNAGYAAGINAAVAASPAYDAILVLNPDVRLTPGCVPRLLAALRVPGTGIAVPHLVDGSGALIHTLRREPSVLRTLGDAVLGARRAGRFRLLGEVITDERAYVSQGVTDWAEGSTQLISAECWSRVAPWDESYFLYSEETDFALRARDLGLRTRYVPDAHAVHLEGDSRVSPGLWALLTLNRVRLFGRRHGPVRTAAYWAALLLRESSRAALGRKPSRAATRDLLTPSRLRETPGPASVARVRAS
ncbi:glycosyl transferase family 2 [Actinoplanes sp. SE50]|uniref:glycosyltransferase n=1 Tax=unclassified Actinoplanes TaxID=2626549 RepID=UPI00023EBD20|nr:MULTISPECIES: glycosyltransferase family 2 protein [unclassified Actinoplanes]AEV83997.1 Polypeptide N-acetylgalactosaminyltransferase 5 [Actinoplanes sp. SE50/110]ATO82390.1 glycosyl transferase family 2 [Actinoplanes sp. SE50]SLL99797.1 glycosyl transferase family 2 [Actinoplanes sp. SE50/110]